MCVVGVIRIVWCDSKQSRTRTPTQIGRKNQVEGKQMPKVVTVEDALDLLKDVLASAGERDIYTGDTVDLFIMTRDGFRTETLQLRED